MKLGNSKSVTGNVLASVFFGMTLVAVTVGIFSRNFLPNVYSYDGYQIEALAQGKAYVSFDTSFSSAGSFYQILGLAEQPFAVSVIGPLVMAIALWVTVRKSLLAGDLTTWLVCFVGLGLSSIYLSWYSKELIALIACSLFVLLVGKYEIPAVSFIVLYAAIFRQYWFLVVLIYVILRFINRKYDFRWKTLGFTTIAALILLVNGYEFLFKSSLADVRSNVNQFRVGLEDATTMITVPFPGADSLSVIVSSLYVFVNLIFPFRLLLLGKLTYVLTAIAAGTLWTVAYKKIASSKSVDPSFAASRKATLLLQAYLIVMCVFEPDFGSYFRHLTPAFVIMALAVFQSPNRSNEKESTIVY